MNSFYSITNGAVADLASELNNSQFRMTLPLGQMDNRTIFTNILGTTYLFARDDQAGRIPYGFKKIDSAEIERVDKPGISHTDVYESENSVPLMYMNYHTEDENHMKSSLRLKKRKHFLIMLSLIIKTHPNVSINRILKNLNLKRVYLKLMAKLLQN